jgi:CBS domain-containing protein
MNGGTSLLESFGLQAESQSLAELFHLVSSLIPEGQDLVVASPEMTVAEAIRLMQNRDFSQLPVVAGQAVLGVFSFRSLAVKLLEMGKISEHFGDLPVDEFMEEFRFVHLSDNWESIVDHLDNDDGVLVGHREQLEGILTPMDVLTYLRDIANPFVLLAEIELSLRRIIRACVRGDELQTCVRQCLAGKYPTEEMPTGLSQMTFNDSVQIIGDGRNWPHFEIVFGKGEWQRKRTVERLKAVRDLRNDVFHFKRKLLPEDIGQLTRHRDWLQTKTRAFEAKKQEEAQVRIGVDERTSVATGSSLIARQEGTQGGPLAKRHILRREFWAQLLEQANQKTLLHSRISPSTQNWLNTGAGKGGLALQYRIRVSDAEVGLRIRRGDVAESKRIFDALQANREEIEQAFGDSLEWLRQDNIKASWIRYVISDGGLLDREDWAEIQRRMVDAMIRLERALKPEIRRLK